MPEICSRTVSFGLNNAQEGDSRGTQVPSGCQEFSRTGDWAAFGATFGRVASKNQTIFGYKLHLLITLSGVILDSELAPANATNGCERRAALQPYLLDGARWKGLCQRPSGGKPAVS